MSHSESALRLKKLREFLGYSQREMANEFKVTSGAIAHWEMGTRPIPGPVIKLMELYEQTIEGDKGALAQSTIEALESSRELLKLMVKLLKKENLHLEERTTLEIGRIMDGVLKEAFSRNRVVGRIKVALARQLIRQLEGSFGLSIKAIQMASFLELGLPPEIPILLGEVQLQGKPLPFERIKRVLETAYDRPLDKVFARFNSEPLAVTSLGQIHRARLNSGEEVVVKVQHPDITKILNGQFKKLSVLSYLADLIGKRSAGALDEIQKQVLLELDYEREAYNQERIRNIFEGDSRIVIPRVHREISTRNVLVSDFEPGIPFSSFKVRGTAQEKSQVASALIHFQGHAIFRHGILYADPHPGNFLFRKGQVVILDFGRVVEYEPEEVETERQLFYAILNRKKDEVFDLLRKRGLITDPESFDYEGYWNLLERQLEHHFAKVPTKITRTFLRNVALETQSFSDRKKLRLSKVMMGSFITNLGLSSLFADLEAEVHWRDVSIKYIEPKTIN